jgi:hypothetical protein
MHQLSRKRSMALQKAAGRTSGRALSLREGKSGGIIKHYASNRQRSVDRYMLWCCASAMLRRSASDRHPFAAALTVATGFGSESFAGLLAKTADSSGQKVRGYDVFSWTMDPACGGGVVVCLRWGFKTWSRGILFYWVGDAPRECS